MAHDCDSRMPEAVLFGVALKSTPADAISCTTIFASVELSISWPRTTTNMFVSGSVDMFNDCFADMKRFMIVCSFGDIPNRIDPCAADVLNL